MTDIIKTKKTPGTISTDLKGEINLTAETMKKILDNVYDEVMAIDASERVIYANETCENHYRGDSPSMVGEYISDLPIWYNWEPRSLPIMQKQKIRVTLDQISPTGEKIITTATPVLDHEGEIELIVYNVRNLLQLDAVKHDFEIIREMLEAAKANKNLEKKVFEKPQSELIAHDPKMTELVEFAAQIAIVDSTVLIQGESGTGKGIIAKYIHNKSLRKEAPFLVINCAAIPENLLESELFGYAAGSFTGASKKGKKGLIELAAGGTLFLDEIGELSPHLQAKFLHVIQDKQYVPVGGRKIKQANVRIIAASNLNLVEMIKLGKFREDLYYRLNVVGMNVPPLRERPQDIMILALSFLKKFNSKYNYQHELSPGCLEVLQQNQWKGNVRELENLIERLVVTVKGTIIDISHLPNTFSESTNTQWQDALPRNASFFELRDNLERELITRAYKELGSSRKVAKSLKISQSLASKLIRKYC
jgi:transcriptional regulator with PAS, ATPase and Fis domain